MNVGIEMSTGDFFQAFRSSKPHLLPNDHPSCKSQQNEVKRVVEKLGLLYGSEEEKPSNFELPCEGGLEEDYVPVEEVLDGLEDMSKRSEALREAFKIFDKDRDGYIDAKELKWLGYECN
ncbi:hypothetical protein L6164_015869 [Bauhinia variegata]|uniref:Uncharacterized protein n=1 Tax=Bauhinia variegata TaxID=167791 RepID=A0ACB9NLX8_BAUVA|nr:hypothetical protein L6164_015869 [Bauhinia variegata]